MARQIQPSLSRIPPDTPPPGFCEHPLLTPQPVIAIARTDQLPLLQQQLDLTRGGRDAAAGISSPFPLKRTTTMPSRSVAYAFCIDDLLADSGSALAAV